jgi:Holliday junction DNA helicase RuvB
MALTERAVTGDIIRARTWDEYVGQDALKRQLDITIRARLEDCRPLDSMLLAAPPGVGKTTLAAVVADRLGDPFHVFKMPVNIKDFAYFLREFRVGIILLDELHAAPRGFQEKLLPAIEDGMFYLPDGRQVDTQFITFIGATTEEQAIIKPLWDRFMLKPVFEDYSNDDMRKIVENMAIKLEVELPDGLAEKLARATAGTPRLAGALVRAARDLAIIGDEMTLEAILTQANVDADGLTTRHMHYLQTLDMLGGLAGLHTLMSLLQLNQSVVEDLERLLLRRGYISREPTGRTLRAKGTAKLGVGQPPMGIQRKRQAS